MITLIAGIVILIQFDPVFVHIKQRQRELPKKLEKSRKEKKDADIVFFGDSLMQTATPPTEAEINSILTKSASKPVRAVNLSIDGRTAYDLERRADQILRLNPKIIVLQPEMMVGRVTQVKERKPRFLEEQSKRLKDWISYAKSPLIRRYITGGSTKKSQELLDALSSPAQVDIGILKDTNPKEETEDQIFLRTVREHWTAQRISLRSPEYNYSRNFIQKAVANGARVIVVETPISQTAAQFATEEYLRKRKEVILNLLGGDQSLYLSYPKILPDQFFYDYAHANRKGQKVFFKWLAPMLAQKLLEEK